ncbi:MAG TPA: Uma2 family endonuclease [Thermomicrobiales bacterium]|jgi:Uma2 family endonuclease
MVAVQSPLLTPEEYLAFERESDVKHEYVAGEIIAMAGANRRHNLIQMDTGTTLNLQLRGRNCEVYPSDMRVKVGALGIYTYPDITVVCGDAELEDAEQDTLLNPTVIIEILSPTTQRYDRELKFHRYQLIPSLRDYLLIAQDRPTIEHYALGDDRRWLPALHEGLVESVALRSIGCSLALAEVYRKVRFDSASAS